MEVKTNFKSIADKIENHKYEEVEKELREIINSKDRTQKAIDTAYYFLGYINVQYENKHKDKFFAKDYFLKNIKSNNPVRDSYIQFDKLEDDKNIVLNCLNKGIDIFKGDPKLIKLKLEYSDEDDKILLIKDNLEKNIIDYDLIKLEIDDCIKLKEWALLLDVSKVAIENFTEDLNDNLDFKFTYSLSVIMCNKKENLDLAIKYLDEIIKNDLINRFSYSTYVLISYAHLLNDNKVMFKKFFDRIPVNNCLCDLDEYPTCHLSLSFENIYSKIFKCISTELNKDSKRKNKLNALYSLYLYHPSEIFTTCRFNKKDIKNVETIFEIEKTQTIGMCLFNMYRKFSMNQKAFTILLEVAKLKYDVYIDTSDLIEMLQNATNDDLNFYSNELSKNLDDYYYIHNFNGITTVLIDELFKRKKYKEITNICEEFGVKFISDSKFAFNSAYSYGEIDNQDKAKEIYENMLTKDQDNSAVINNLGVIYEKQKNYSKSFELFKKANELDPNEINIRNLERLSKILNDKLKEERNVKDRTIKNIGSNLSLDYFENLGYNDNLKQMISNITETQLKIILQRDLESAVVALATKQYKSADILLGSILETVLSYILRLNNINSFKFNIGGNNKTIKVENMTLVQLLEVAYENKYLDKKKLSTCLLY